MDQELEASLRAHQAPVRDALSRSRLRLGVRKIPWANPTAATFLIGPTTPVMILGAGFRSNKP